MNFIESIKSAFRSVFSNKMRSFLTMLGIIIGISSVIMISSVGQGAQNSISKEFESFGANMLQISLKSWQDTEYSDYLREKDLEIIKKHPSIKYISGFSYYSADTKLKNPKETRKTQLLGVSPDYNLISPIDIIHGRYVTDNDNMSRGKVCIIDDALANKIFGYEECTGQKISVVTWRGTYKLTVIGVYKNPNGILASAFADQMPSQVYLPVNTVQNLFGRNYYEQIFATLDDSTQTSSTALEIVDMLHRSHRIEDTYYVQNSADQLKEINKVLGLITMFISFVAAISLLVGGVGVMNIMLVTVTERTREIGIRKSLGAKNRDIKVQFLIESIILTFIGGTIGFILGYLGGYLVGLKMKITPSVSPFMVILTISISCGIGILFGVYPASKAAKLDPIEALRYE